MGTSTGATYRRPRPEASGLRSSKTPANLMGRNLGAVDCRASPSRNELGQRNHGEEPTVTGASRPGTGGLPPFRGGQGVDGASSRNRRKRFVRAGQGKGSNYSPLSMYRAPGACSKAPRRCAESPFRTRGEEERRGWRMDKHAVVIAGGGPTGMMLAAELALAKVDVAVVEQRPDHVLVGSRAGGFHSRTIELLDQRGVADRFLAEGKVAQAAMIGTTVLGHERLPDAPSVFTRDLAEPDRADHGCLDRRARRCGSTTDAR